MNPLKRLLARRDATPAQSHTDSVVGTFGEPLSHVNVVSSNPDFGLVRIQTDLDRGGPGHLVKLRRVAEAIAERTGHDDYQLAGSINEVQLLRVPSDKIAGITEDLKGLARDNAEAMGGVLNDRQIGLLKRLKADQITTRAMQAEQSGDVTLIKIPIVGATESEGVETAGLLSTLLSEKGVPVKGVAYDGIGGNDRTPVLRVHVDFQSTDRSQLEGLGAKMLEAVKSKALPDRA